MKTITRKTKLKENPLFKDFPKELKDPKSYKKVESKLRLIMYSDHSHSTIKAFINCPRCVQKVEKRKEALKSFGFTSVEQYMVWKKIMDIVINKRELDLKIR